MAGRMCRSMSMFVRCSCSEAWAEVLALCTESEHGEPFATAEGHAGRKSGQPVIACRSTGPAIEQPTGMIILPKPASKSLPTAALAQVTTGDLQPGQHGLPAAARAAIRMSTTRTSPSPRKDLSCC